MSVESNILLHQKCVKWAKIYNSAHETHFYRRYRSPCLRIFVNPRAVRRNIPSTTSSKLCQLSALLVHAQDRCKIASKNAIFLHHAIHLCQERVKRGILLTLGIVTDFHEFREVSLSCPSDEFVHVRRIEPLGFLQFVPDLYNHIIVGPYFLRTHGVQPTHHSILGFLAVSPFLQTVGKFVFWPRLP